MIEHDMSRDFLFTKYEEPILQNVQIDCILKSKSRPGNTEFKYNHSESVQMFLNIMSFIQAQITEHYAADSHIIATDMSASLLQNGLHRILRHHLDSFILPSNL